MKYSKFEESMLLKQYELYVAGMEKISDRRHLTNSWFITINTAVITVAAIIYNIKNLSVDFCIFNAISLVGIILSVLWFLLIISYKQLNTGKFKIIHKLEKDLPAKLYTEEWDALGKGKNIFKYIPFSHIEVFVPLVFLALYAVLLIYSMRTCSHIYSSICFLS